jgi:hypothetical protein
MWYAETMKSEQPPPRAHGKYGWAEMTPGKWFLVFESDPSLNGNDAVANRARVAAYHYATRNGLTVSTRTADRCTKFYVKFEVKS